MEHANVVRPGRAGDEIAIASSIGRRESPTRQDQGAWRMPHACRPPRVLSPVQMMISVRSGRIASASLRETTTRLATRRPFGVAASGSTGRISPLASVRNFSTTKRSSARPVSETTRQRSVSVFRVAFRSVEVTKRRARSKRAGRRFTPRAPRCSWSPLTGARSHAATNDRREGAIPSAHVPLRTKG